MYIDTHCHLDDQRLIDTDKIIADCEKNKVQTLIHVGCNIASSTFGKTTAEKYKSVFFTAGYHPSDSGDYNEQTKAEIEKLLSHKKCVGVGEIGLDYHYDFIDRNTQKQCFISQLELAIKNDLPVSIHMRDATEDTVNILKEYSKTLNKKGVIHCFSGSTETAKIMLDNGFMIAFGGTVTFKNARNLIEVANFVPLDMMLTETDSPYLAPTPLRGTTNTPSNVAIITNFLASLKNIEIEQFSKQILSNAKRLFNNL